MRLIGADGEQIGLVDIDKARTSAEDLSLDLVEIVPNAEPPVCRIMDYGKFRFEQSKKTQAAKKKQKQISIKEIKFRPNTDIGDYNIKYRKIVEFLEAGNKTKVTMRFRGREMAHQEVGMELLNKLEKDLDGIGKVEQRPSLEGRALIMVFGPDKASKAKGQ